MNPKLYALLLMSGMLGGQTAPTAHQNELSPDQRKYIFDRNKRMRADRQGLKDFEIDGYKVTALNYKNALRKVNNLRHGK